MGINSVPGSVILCPVLLLSSGLEPQTVRLVGESIINPAFAGIAQWTGIGGKWLAFRACPYADKAHPTWQGMAWLLAEQIEPVRHIVLVIELIGVTGSIGIP